MEVADNHAAESRRPCTALLLADDRHALVEVCGISLLDRLLRNLQRIGFTRAMILSAQPGSIAAHLARPSWARTEITSAVRARKPGPLTVNEVCEFAPDEGLLIVSAGVYCDSRLLRALLSSRQTTLLLDSRPPPAWSPLLQNAERHERGWLCQSAFVLLSWLRDHNHVEPLFEKLAQTKETMVVDVDKEPAYVVQMRRSIRPLWFPAPEEKNIALAEHLLLDAAQNGTLDLPAKVHAPIETWIIARLCKTRVTPNQITLLTAVISGAVTVLFASGKLGAGTVLALAVGVLDGLDGKQARVKVETTKLGKREHVLDYMLELSWWAALAFHFTSTRQLPVAGWWFVLLFGSDLLDRLAKAAVKKRGRNLDDVSTIDRFVRLIGGRRNIYVWMLAAGLALGVADQAFLSLCVWGAMTAAVHVWRAFSIRLRQQSVAT